MLMSTPDQSQTISEPVGGSISTSNNLNWISRWFNGQSSSKRRARSRTDDVSLVIPTVSETIGTANNQEIGPLISATSS